MFSLGQFKFVIASSEEDKEKVYRLRYRTYVEEFGFEKPEDHPGGLETDEYDPYSVHFAVFNGSDDIVGTIRLILHSEQGFPVEQVANPSFVGKKPNSRNIAEISRFAVSDGSRRRRLGGWKLTDRSWVLQ